MTEKLNVSELSQALAKGKLSSVELTQLCLEKCSEQSELGAFITLLSDNAIAAAKASDRRRANGESLGALDGIPFAIKDNFCFEGAPTTCASRMLKDFIPPYTATAVNRLMSAGAVPLGKANMDEFAMGTSSKTSAFGIVKNPYDPDRTAGGSSGGSAVSVAAGIVPFSLGSDTGGSVRLPAAYCGVLGMKPTYGCVSRYGLIAYASSLDTVGVFSTCARDNALVLSTIAGKDPMDMTSLDMKIDTNVCDNDIKGMRVGIPYAALDGLSSEIREAVLSVAAALEAMGAVVIDVSLPLSIELLATYCVVSFSEAFSNLSRFDGVRYGCRPDGAQSADELFTLCRSAGFGDEVKKRILLGSLFLSGEGRDELFRRAITVQNMAKAKLGEAFALCDAVLMPVTSGIAPSQGELLSRAPVDSYRDDIFCVLANLCGVPALSFPAGMGKKGLPIGVQLLAPERCDERLYTLCAAYEKAKEAGL